MNRKYFKIAFNFYSNVERQSFKPVVLNLFDPADQKSWNTNAVNNQVLFASCRKTS